VPLHIADTISDLTTKGQCRSTSPMPFLALSAKSQCRCASAVRESQCRSTSPIPVDPEDPVPDGGLEKWVELDDDVDVGIKLACRLGQMWPFEAGPVLITWLGACPQQYHFRPYYEGPVPLHIADAISGPVGEEPVPLRISCPVPLHIADAMSGLGYEEPVPLRVSCARKPMLLYWLVLPCVCSRRLVPLCLCICSISCEG
jgi:hypothetical protein